MARKRSPEDLSVDELRWLLVEKRRAARQDRLERYRRTGRALVISSDAQSGNLDSLRSGSLEEGKEPIQRSRSRRIFDAFLLLIEVSAVVGVLFVLFNGLNVIRALNQEVAAALVQPTFTPTPLIEAVVLPSGHTPPNSVGGAQPNDAEIPEHLRARVQSLANLPLPTPSPEQAIRIQIPGLNVDSQIVQGDGWEELKRGVAQHIGSANPGNTGNVVLSGHNDIFGEVFRYLDRLKPGDQVILFTNQRSYTYLVVDTKVVEPTAVEVMAQTEQPFVTLISCYPYLVDKQRIVVTARLQGSGE